MPLNSFQSYQCQFNVFPLVVLTIVLGYLCSPKGLLSIEVSAQIRNSCGVEEVEIHLGVPDRPSYLLSALFIRIELLLLTLNDYYSISIVLLVAD